MTRTFAALKWRLVVNGLTRTRFGILGAIGALMGFMVAGVFALGSISAGRGTSRAIGFRAGGLGTYLVVFAIWTFGPLLVGVDETVDPSRLALLPLPALDLRRGIVAASLVGFGPVAAAIMMIGIAVGYVRASLGGAVVIVAVVAGYALALSASRALATMLVRAQRSRRGRDISVVIAAVIGAGFWFASQIAPRLSHGTQERLFNVMRYTPPGFAGQAIVDASRGHVGHAVAGVVAALGCTVLFAWAWLHGVTALLVDEGAVSTSSARPATAAHDDARGGELRAATRKELRYLARSPARRSTTLVAIVLGTGFVLLQVFQHGGSPPKGIVLLAPLAGVFGLSAINNQLGHDGASLWIEVVAAGPRRAELLARELSWLPALVGPSVPVAVILGAITHGWTWVPISIGLAVAACGVPIGVGALLSVLAPVLVPDDVNPFLNRQANTGRGCVVGLASLGAITTDAVLLAPVIVAVAVVHEHGVLGVAALLVPIALYACAIWALGVTLAVRRLRGREPELLAVFAQPY